MGWYYFKLFAHSALCLVIMWSCFCRQARSDSQTLESVRMAFWLLFIAANLLLVAPWAHSLFAWPRYRVQWPVLGILAAFCLVQVVIARHWHRGAPPAFQRPVAAPPAPPPRTQP